MTRILLDKGIIRRALEGFVRVSNQQALTEEQRTVLRVLRAYDGSEQLYMSYKSTHTLSHRFGHIDFVQRLLSRIPPLYPTRYARRWARRLRDLGVGREDALTISMGSFRTDKLYGGHLLGVDQIVSLDKRMQERFLVRHTEIQLLFENMIATLNMWIEP